MEKTIIRNTVKFAVTKAIFCQCGIILDTRKAFLLTDLKKESTRILCSDCFAKVNSIEGLEVWNGEGKVVGMLDAEKNAPSIPLIREGFKVNHGDLLKGSWSGNILMEGEGMVSDGRAIIQLGNARKRYSEAGFRKLSARADGSREVDPQLALDILSTDRSNYNECREWKYKFHPKFGWLVAFQLPGFDSIYADGRRFRLVYAGHSIQVNGKNPILFVGDTCNALMPMEIQW